MTPQPPTIIPPTVTTPTGITIRILPATADDCGHVADMSNAIHVEHEYDNPPHSADSIHAMMFGPHALIRSLIAWHDGRPIGQVIYQPFYNPDYSVPGLWMTELYVVPEMRSAKIGHILMQMLARLALEGGYISVWWSVLRKNEAALRFYDRLGARNSGSTLYEIDGPELGQLAQLPGQE